MGNTYDGILEESEQRWYAERANIMSSMEINMNTKSRENNRRRYAVELLQGGNNERFLQVEFVQNADWLNSDSDAVNKKISEFEEALHIYMQSKVDISDGPDKECLIQNHLRQIKQLL